MLFKINNLIKFNKKILYFTASNGLGNALVEMSVIKFLYPESKVYLFTSNINNINRIFTSDKNIKVINYPWSWKFRLIVEIIKMILFRLTKFRILSLIHEYNDNENNRVILEKKGILNKICLVEFKSHFQIKKYLEKVSLPIELKLFDSDIKSLISKNEKLKSVNWEKSCFVHIRRGDYMFYPDTRYPAILDLDWFKKSIEIIKDKKNIEYFLIFSNDRFYINDFFEKNNEIVIHHEDVLNDLLIMSKCKHGILSASSLSWCAATLSKDRFKSDQYFIAPNHWIGHRKKIWYPKNFKFEWIKYI